MKLSAQEEIGLRCLVQLAQREPGGAATIHEVASAEGLSSAYVAKVLAVLRRADLVVASRGRDGGYVLARAAEAITLSEALVALGGRLYDTEFCAAHAGPGAGARCAHDGNCSIRPVIVALDRLVHDALSRVTLKSLVRSEPAVHAWLKARLSPVGNEE
ncbi:MAG: Rrf2 family transcriptional regulator [Candidatus Eisenbacteria bacterium]